MPLRRSSLLSCRLTNPTVTYPFFSSNIPGMQQASIFFSAGTAVLLILRDAPCICGQRRGIAPLLISPLHPWSLSRRAVAPRLAPWTRFSMACLRSTPSGFASFPFPLWSTPLYFYYYSRWRKKFLLKSSFIYNFFCMIITIYVQQQTAFYRTPIHASKKRCLESEKSTCIFSTIALYY